MDKLRRGKNVARRARSEYVFESYLIYERLSGCEYRCESCGKETQLFGHHLISCYLASRNSKLTPDIIKSIVNVEMVCGGCHKEEDADQKKWTIDDIAHLAWALFDLDPYEVMAAQNGTYLEEPVLEKSVNKKNKRRKRRKEKRRKYLLKLKEGIK